MIGACVGAQAALAVADDVRHVIVIAPPLGLLDWTFASGLGVPLTVIVGDADQFCPAERLARLATTDVTVLPGADHFLAGRDEQIAAAVRATLQGRA